ncbi:hypothetical protein VTN77DRAFT_4084 [Rasamsonia byssochlamydoides]|uniref:uncharacterized protein n=1 Tax=Rasamsonia byssochlamydoides TaxID=89139 RepID=UPI0037437D85
MEVLKMNVYRVILCVHMSFNEQIKRGCDFMVRAEIKPLGEKHPQVWAIKAREYDPAARLAFCVSGELVNGEKFEDYPCSNSDEAPMMANSFVDWMQGATEEEIATRARRFVFIHKNRRIVSEHLKKFLSEEAILTTTANLCIREEGDQETELQTQEKQQIHLSI